SRGLRPVAAAGDGELRGGRGDLALPAGVVPGHERGGARGVLGAGGGADAGCRGTRVGGAAGGGVVRRDAGPRGAGGVELGREGLRWVMPYAAVTAAYVVAHALLVHAPRVPPYIDPQALRLGRAGVALMFPGYLAFLWPAFPHTAGVTLPLAAARNGLLVTG